MSSRCAWLMAVSVAGLGLARLAAGQAVTGTTFTYQGQLQATGSPANGTYDIRLRLYDAATGGAQVGATLCHDNVPVSNGQFTVALDFGAVFTGPARWLELAVRADSTAGNCGTGIMTVLSPRQPLTSAPYAAGLALPQTLTTSAPGGPALSITNTTGDGIDCYATGTARSGVYGVSSVIDGYGVFGRNTATGRYGALGQGYAGVFGGNDTDGGRGGWFADSTPTGVGVLGQANSTTGLNYGVFGVSNSNAGIGVYGITQAGAGNLGAVMGVALGLNGNGVFGQADNGPLAVGVIGWSHTGWGVQGTSSATTGTTYGVIGQAVSPAGVGVYGEDFTGIGVWGESDSFYGVKGDSNTAPGVYGQSTVEDGVVGFSQGTGKSGVFGYTNLAGGFGVSGWNWSGATNGALATGTSGVFGASYVTSGPSYGVRGEGTGAGAYGGYFVGRGYFSDNVGINVTQPSVPLHVAGGTDASLGGGGNIVVGQVNAANLVIDNNEVMARNNGAAANLYLNALGGQVGIGTNAPNALLSVNGAASKPGGGSWSSFSDRRLKKNVRPLTGALETLLSLRGVTFEYIDPASINELPGTRTGMVAQEVEMVVPDWVDQGPDGMKRITYRGFEALTVEAMRDQQRQMDALRAENAALRDQLASLASDVATLKSRAGVHTQNP